MNVFRNERSRSAFTLFEVLVALALSVVLMSMIGFAMQFYAQQLNTRDSEARRTQLARSILRMMAEDLEACIYPEKFDPTSLAEVLASSASGASSGGGSASTSDSSSDSVVEVEGADELEVSDLAESPVVTLRPGLIGNQYQIQFDVSRLPRMEEYTPMMLDPTQLGMQDVASDVKSVAYYVQQQGLTGVGDNVQKLQQGAVASFQSGGGLVRRALSRELTSYATQSGDGVQLNQTGDLIAPEVIGLEFAYFDGTQWVYQWDSDELGALPMAVQVRITMKNADADALAASGGLASTGSVGAPMGEVYDLMVRLPMAKIAPADEAATEIP